MPDDRKRPRYAVRPDTSGFTVYEIWTGKPVVLGRAPQTGLSEADAQHTAELMNQRAAQGDSSLRS